MNMNMNYTSNEKVERAAMASSTGTAIKMQFESAKT